MKMRSTARLLFASTAVALSLGFPAFGETLTDALIKAYRTSPLLEANRASLRALDENVPQARSQRRPQVSATAGARLQTDVQEFPFDDLYAAELNAQLLLFDSGQTRAAIESARNTVAAGRASLVGVEQQVLFDAVSAYTEVLQALEFLRIAQNDVRVLEEQVEATRNRFEVGEVTRTDVSQTEARLAGSRGTLVDARGNLELSRQAYLAAVGALPGNLDRVPPLPALPASISQAEQLALRQHPDVIAAQFSELAALADFDRARAASRPSISAGTGVDYSGQYSLFPQGDDSFNLNLELNGSVPLYSGGANSSLIRQAQQVLEQRKFQVQDAGRAVIQEVNNAWSQLLVARALIVANNEQVVAAQIAFEGVTEEARLGARSTLDVLDADQERLQAEAEVVRSQRDEYVAAYSVLRAIGLLTVRHLDLGIESYDPDVYYTQVQTAPMGGYDTGAVDRIRARWRQE
jgi:outer membrane protein